MVQRDVHRSENARPLEIGLVLQLVLTVVFKSLVNLLRLPVSSTWCPVMRLLHLISALPFVPAALAWTTYTVPHSGGGDDTPALISALSSRPELTTDATILFQAGLTYNLKTPVNFPYLNNVLIKLEGNLTFANDIGATQGANSKVKRLAFGIYNQGCPSSDCCIQCKQRYSLIFFRVLNVPFLTALQSSLVCSRDFPHNGNLTPTFLRICFSKGGRNVTMQGSTDPKRGWISNDGQKVGEKLLAADCRLLTRSCTSGGMRYTKVE